MSSCPKSCFTNTDPANNSIAQQGKVTFRLFFCWNTVSEWNAKTQELLWQACICRTLLLPWGVSMVWSQVGCGDWHVPLCFTDRFEENKGLFSGDFRVSDMFALFEKCRDGLWKLKIALIRFGVWIVWITNGMIRCKDYTERFLYIYINTIRLQ